MEEVADCPINGALKLFTLLERESVCSNIQKRVMAMLINFTIHHDHLSKKLMNLKRLDTSTKSTLLPNLINLPLQEKVAFDQRLNLLFQYSFVSLKDMGIS